MAGRGDMAPAHCCSSLRGRLAVPQRSKPKATTWPCKPTSSCTPGEVDTACSQGLVCGRPQQLSSIAKGGDADACRLQEGNTTTPPPTRGTPMWKARSAATTTTRRSLETATRDHMRHDPRAATSRRGPMETQHLGGCRGQGGGVGDS